MLNPHYKIKEDNITICSYDVRLLRVTNFEELLNEMAAMDAGTIEV